MEVIRGSIFGLNIWFVFVVGIVGANPLSLLAGDKPDVTPEPIWTAEQRQHWSFIPPTRPSLPEIKNRDWVRNPIDQFILSQIEVAGLKPTVEADRATLIRRVRFDLTGLPPSLDEIRQFTNDDQPEAYERLVDRLLALPEYGERWARSWLDLARYADSDGYKNDKGRPNAWRYRDWVVKALNQDMSYDRFVALQLAGDEIKPGDSDAFIATGFNRNWPFEDNNMVPGLNQQLMLDDMTDTTTAVILGLTVACARCHDHKYDPISQRDYYRIQALFVASQPKDDYVLASAEDQTVHASVQAEHDARVDRLRLTIEMIEHPYVLEISKEKLAKLPAEVRDAFQASPDDRTTEQYALLKKYAKQLSADSVKLKAAIPDDLRQVWQARRGELETLLASAPEPLPVASGITDSGPIAPPAHLFRKGNFASPLDPVDPGFLSVFGSTDLRMGPAQQGSTTTGRRKALAEWLTRPDHPLTARVMVNRLWQGHFGRGIVATPSDFGFQGSSPTHPELLDWLATEFVTKGWSQKALHRLMVTSASYRQSSQASSETVEADPENLLFSRMPRKRLEGEAVRDALLEVAGQLDRRIGGPGVFPELPPGVETRGGWPQSSLAADRNRRSLYVFVKRNLKFPMFDAFDVPDTNLTCPERNISVNAPQALMLLNSDQVHELSRTFAGRVYGATGNITDLNQLAGNGYRLAFGREPTENERSRAVAFLKKQPELISGCTDALTMPIPMPNGATPVQAATVVDFCHALLNLNEFVFVD